MTDQVLAAEAVKLGIASESKDDAVRRAGELLVSLGAADPAYVDAMFEREGQIATYLGEGFAIPHGTNESRSAIKRAAIGFLQYPDGIDWAGNEVTVVIPIASATDEHIGILSALATVLADPESAAQLRSADSVETVLSLLNS